MGWGALSMKDQHPVLADETASQFDWDNEAISRLLIRGLLTQSQARAARAKYVTKVGKAIKAALVKQAQGVLGDAA
jgi:hypothetical protein